jgi:uncharacterized membrane protein YkvA (DUF1232 family)
MGRLLKEMLILAVAAIAAIYLVYPSLGFFELIPDAVPLIGSLDEASATLILVGTLRYYGFDIGKLYGKREQPKQLPQPRRPQSLPE